VLQANNVEEVWSLESLLEARYRRNDIEAWRSGGCCTCSDVEAWSTGGVNKRAKVKRRDRVAAKKTPPNASGVPAIISRHLPGVNPLRLAKIPLITPRRSACRRLTEFPWRHKRRCPADGFLVSRSLNSCKQTTNVFGVHQCKKYAEGWALRRSTTPPLNYTGTRLEVRWVTAHN